MLIEHICSSRIYAAVTVPISPETGDSYVFTGPHPKRLTAEQFVDTLRRLTETSPQNPAFVPPVDEKAEWYRASLTAADRIQLALGRPLRDVVVSTRPEDVTTLQALDLSIGPELHDLLLQGARNLKQRYAEQSPEALIGHVFLNTLSRPPTNEETAVIRQILTGDGQPATGDQPQTVGRLDENNVADFLWAVAMLPEFQTVY